MLDFLSVPTTKEEFLAQREYRLITLENCGIYVIRNIINDHIYIGSSASIKRRFASHRNSLRRNAHRNIHLQNAWNKYGEENFEMFIIESHSCSEMILKRENKYIQMYKPEYNIIQVNNDNQFIHSEETKLKIGIKSSEKFINNPQLKEDWTKRRRENPPWNKGKVGTMAKKDRDHLSEIMKLRVPIFHTRETIDKIAAKNKIPIYQYDLSMNFIKMWDSAADVARFYNASGSGNFCTAVKKGIKLYNSYWRRNAS